MLTSFPRDALKELLLTLPFSLNSFDFLFQDQMLTLLCPVIALGTSGLPLAPSSEQSVLAAALPTTSLGALFLFTVMQQPQGLTGPGLGGCRTSSVSSCASGCLGQHVSGREDAWLICSPCSN